MTLRDRHVRPLGRHERPGRRSCPRSDERGSTAHTATRATVATGTLLGGLAAGYMLFESQWLRCSEQPLPVPALPGPLEGLTILHLSDVHAGQPGFNIRTFEKAVNWAVESRPDLIVLTGDILSSRSGWARCVSLLRRLQAPLGVFAVPGNHEYGLSKNPLAHLPEPPPWESCGIMELRDACVMLDLTAIRGPGADPGAISVALCGADYLSGGAPLVAERMPREADLSILLVHRPPRPEDPLAAMFDLTFSGHTHGGQIRIPTPWGLQSLHHDHLPHLEGVHPWGHGLLAVSAGIGTTFLPLRFLTRPQAVIHRLTAVAAESVGPNRAPPRRSEADTEAAPSGIYEGVVMARDGGGGADDDG